MKQDIPHDPKEAKFYKDTARGRRVYHVLRILIGRIFCALTGFSYEPCEIKGQTFLLLANHTMDIDPICLVIGTKRHMRYVASANIMRGPIGRLIAYLVSPIPRVKGASADKTVEGIRYNLEREVSVAMLPEGNTTWDGETGYIPPRTAQLVKESKGNLVTYRIEGGYLRKPRWAAFRRKGPSYGRLVHEYTREELDRMTADEIYRHICEDLYTNVYEVQKTRQARYRGKKLAEGLDLALYICPACGKLGTLKAFGDTLQCGCGLKAVYTETGFLKGTDLPYDNIRDWNQYQKEWLISHEKELAAQTEKPFLTDTQVELFCTEHGKRIQKESNAAVSLFGDRFEILGPGEAEPMVFLWKDVEKMGAFRRSRVFFTAEGRSYEMARTGGLSGLRYFALYRTLTGKSYV